ncbi:MAG: hypothetical protein EOL88_02735 [Bacteroidia bacterium]|nr:pseudouridine synthase [Bacteroidales bacterium]MDD3960282.1 pseudouridine synthase [Bacteroidales bacterium]MDY0284768.1 pseudouridine synthase [Bacteroidales bacterium]NCD40988.1 hypothetical protein [Bacteroidia bacterium]HPE86378.1 pseudouridine synthase [Bacteroidales bacterium]
MGVEICYSDAYFVVVNKPAGILVHKTNMAIDEKVTLMQRVADQLGRKVYPVHRLDKGTSGVNIFSLDARTSEMFRRMFVEKRIGKIYFAVCRGWLTDEVLVEYPVKTSTLATRVAAVTRIIPLATAEIDVPVGPYEKSRYTLIQAEPHTGRWHQIRQHCSHLRHPIAGDKRHGDYRHNAMFSTQFSVTNVMLHAGAVTFEHPYQLRRITVNAAFPAHWRLVLDTMGWKQHPAIAPFISF